MQALQSVVEQPIANLGIMHKSLELYVHVQLAINAKENINLLQSHVLYTADKSKQMTTQLGCLSSFAHSRLPLEKFASGHTQVQMLHRCQ